MDSLKVDYTDAVFTGTRKYMEVQNADGSKSFNDATAYTQAGDKFGAVDINATNTAVNALAGVKNVTLTLAGWSTTIPYTQIVTVEGILSTDTPIIGLTIGTEISKENIKAMKKGFACIDKIESLDGNIRVTCYSKKPTIAIPLVLKGV